MGAQCARFWQNSLCECCYAEGQELLLVDADQYALLQQSANIFGHAVEEDALQLVQHVRSHEYLMSVKDIAASADGSVVVWCGGSGAIYVYDGETWQEKRTLSSHWPPLCVAVHPTGHLVVSGGGQGEGGVRLWNVTDGSFVLLAAGTAGDESGVLETRREMVLCVDIGESLVVWGTCPDGSGGGEDSLCVYDLDQAAEESAGGGRGGLVHRVREPHGPSQAVSAVQLSANEMLIVSGGGDGTIRLWNEVQDEETGAATLSCMRVLSGHTDFVHRVRFCPGGQHLASRSADNTVRVWDMEQTQHVYSFPCFREGGLDLSGRYLVYGLEGQVAIVDWVKGKRLRILKGGHDGRVSGICISPNGTWLLTGGYDDLSVALWADPALTRDSMR